QAGATLYFLRPYFDNNTALTVTSGLGTPAPAETVHDFRWDYDPAFAAWLGWTGPVGLGLRGRFFRFDETSQPATASLQPAQAVGTTIAVPAGLANLPGGN